MLRKLNIFIRLNQAFELDNFDVNFCVGPFLKMALYVLYCLVNFYQKQNTYNFIQPNRAK